MMRKFKWFLLGLNLFFMARVFADSTAIAHLSVLLNGFTTYQANFQQRTFSEQGRVIQRSHGSMMIKRPGKFRWVSQSPTQQMLLTDGKTLWIYDVDLQQASKQALSNRVSVDPAMLLSGRIKDLAATFVVSMKLTKKGEVFLLTPKKSDMGFEHISMVFENKELVRMTVVNTLSQNSEFDFTNISLNHVIADKIFHFDPPKGVDVVEQ